MMQIFGFLPHFVYNHNMKELWRPIFGFEGLYEISNWGQVKSLGNDKYRKEKILKPRKTRYGYLQVNLSKDGKHYTMRVHRLVAEAFLPNDDLFKTQINHKNENKELNFVWINDNGSVDESKSNLEWCDYTYNNNYGTRNERAAKTNSKVVLQYSLDGVFIKEWQSTKEVQRQLGFCHISECCNGHPKYSHAYGYIWRYKDE